MRTAFYIILATFTGLALIGTVLSAQIFGYFSSQAYGFAVLGFGCLLCATYCWEYDMKKESEECARVCRLWPIRRERMKVKRIKRVLRTRVGRFYFLEGE